MILLMDGVKYEERTPTTEEELARMVKEQAEEIFGEGCLYFGDLKKRLKSPAGVISIPDGWVVIFGMPTRAYPVEIEHSSHSVYGHISPQIDKICTALKHPVTQHNIISLIYDEISKDDLQSAKARAKIGSQDLYKVLTDSITKEQLQLVIVIDNGSEELQECVENKPVPPEIVEFRTFRRKGAESVHIYQFEPLFGGVEQTGEGRREVTPPEGAKKVSSRNQQYQRFFTDLVDRYCRQYPQQPRLKALPQSYLGFGAGKAGLWFEWVFRGNKMFCVELYISTGDQAKNKQYFDELKRLEAQIAITNISWERLEEKKASRIALYTAGDIQEVMDDGIKREKLLQWGAETMKDFSDKLKTIVKRL